MAYDTGLEERIDEVVAEWQVDVLKRKMFGGLGYFINRNMAFGVKGDELIVKADEVTAAILLDEPGMGPFEFGGRSMKAWLLAALESLAGKRNIVEAPQVPEQPEEIANAKGYLTGQLRQGHRYSETVDQPALSSIFSFAEAEACDSFCKLRRDFRFLLSHLFPGSDRATETA